MSDWKELIPPEEIRGEITEKSVDFSRRFGEFLAKDERKTDENGRPRVLVEHLTSSQLRRFFGEIKRQQMTSYNKTEFILLKPKLAYAVGRTDKKSKISDFYMVITDAIDKVKDEKSFENFVKIFEAIVAYHKAAEPKK